MCRALRQRREIWGLSLPLLLAGWRACSPTSPKYHLKRRVIGLAGERARGESDREWERESTTKDRLWYDCRDKGISESSAPLSQQIASPEGVLMAL